MKFTCKQKSFSEGLQTVAKAISSNNTLPVLDNILLKAEGNTLHLTATDLEISISTFIEVDIEEEGAITIPAKVAVQYISLLPSGEEIQVALKDETLWITSPSSDTKIKGIAAEEFPIIPQVEDFFSMKVKKDTFLKGASQVTFSTSHNTARPILAGIFLTLIEGKLFLVSTDSFRLSEKSIEVETSENDYNLKIIVPAKSMQEVMRVFGKDNLEEESIDVSVAKNQIKFESGNTVLVSRLIEGEFPNYKQIIPTEEKSTCYVHTADFLLALKRVNLFAKENNFNVKFQLQPEEQKIQITTDASEIGEEQTFIETIDAKGEEILIALNSQFVIDVLTNISADHVHISFINTMSPAVFKPQSKDGEVGKDYLHLVMPLKV